jgi:hypothetical protein
VLMPMSDHRCLRVPLPMIGRLGVGGHQDLPADGHETGIVAITEGERFPVSPAVGLLSIRLRADAAGCGARQAGAC